MTRLYSNNFQSVTTEVLPIARDYVELASTTGLSRPDGIGVEHEVLAFTDGTNYEVVHMDWRDEPGDSFPNRIYLVRAQESTTAREWPTGTTVYAGITAAMLGEFEGSLRPDGFVGVFSLAPATVDPGAAAIHIQPSRGADADIASGASSVAIGPSSKASAEGGVAIGRSAKTDSLHGIVIGDGAQALPSGAFSGTPYTAIAIGYQASVTADGDFGVAIGDGAASSNTNAIALGNGAAASGIRSLALGGSTTATGTNGVAVGWTSAAAASGVAVGNGAEAVSEQSIAIGAGAYAEGGIASIAIGGSSSNGALSMAIGEATSTAPRSLALGWGEVHHQDVMNHSFLPAALSTDQATDNADAFWYNSTDEVVAISAAIDLKTAATTTLAVLPSGGVTFYADEIGLIVQSANTVTVQPEISFGITGNNTKLLGAVTTTGLTAAKKRQRFSTLLSADGETSYTFTVNTAATATTLTARVYVRGFAIQDEIV